MVWWITDCGTQVVNDLVAGVSLWTQHNKATVTVTITNNISNSNCLSQSQYIKK